MVEVLHVADGWNTFLLWFAGDERENKENDIGN
jgi:hypothetical protein